MAFQEASKELAGLLQRRLPPSVLNLLEQAGELAEAASFRIYLVGGAVRDLLLGLETIDLDLVVEGDGVAFAEAFAGRFGGTVKRHRQFGTATILWPDGGKFDVATTRTEVYERPAALPKVKPGSLREDLFRRDFTINALAVSLNPKNFGRLIDPFGGEKDLRDGVVRALHGESYLDDPTRIVRAVRFEARYGFQIDERDEKLIREAIELGLLMRLSEKRRWTELWLLLREADPYRPLKRLEALGALRAIHPGLTLEKTLFQRIEETLAWAETLPLPSPTLSLPLVGGGLGGGLPLQSGRGREGVWLYLLALLAPLPTRSIPAAGRRLGLPPKLLQQALVDLKVYRALKRARSSKRPLRPSLIHRLGLGASVEALLLAGSRSETIRRALATYFAALENRVHLKGEDLKALGFSQGPIYREILDALRSAKLDGLVRSREEELQYLKRRFGPLIAHQRRLIRV